MQLVEVRAGERSGRDLLARVPLAEAERIQAEGLGYRVGRDRLRYVRLKLGAQWSPPPPEIASGTLALWRRAMQEHTVPAKVSGRPQSGLRWLPQLSKAKLGCGGSVAANLLGSRGSRNGKLSTLVSGGLALCQRGERLIQVHTAATPAEVI
jgi:hypothetical protein